MTNLTVYKYFLASIQILWSCVFIYISSGFNKVIQVGTHRLVVVSIAVMVCRALKMCPGTVVVPWDLSMAGIAP